MEKESVEKLQQSIDLIAKTTADILGKIDGIGGRINNIEENMSTKKDLALAEFRLQTQISGLETDLKSFKEEVRGR